METIKEEVSKMKRRGIEHLEKMSDSDFIDFLNKIKKEMNGKLSDIPVFAKVDGLGARFGKDGSGQFFFESSRSGPVFDPNSFVEYTKAKTDDPVLISRAMNYVDIFNTLKKSKVVEVLPNDTKVYCEIFFNPMAVEDGDYLTFVTVKYDKKKLGKLMTILPFSVYEASSGEEKTNKKEIVDSIINASNDVIKVVNPKMKMGTIDINGFIDALSTLDSDAKEVLKSRKAADRQRKNEISDIIKKTKVQMSKFILDSSEITDKQFLGPNFEGIVLHIDGKEYKITTDEFRASKAKNENVIDEAIDDSRVLPRQNKQVELFQGRLQPIHNGHKKIIDKMKNPIVMIVKGSKSSSDKERNPLSVEVQESLLKKIFGNKIRILISPSGYLPFTVFKLRDEGLEVVKMYAGADRIDGYRNLVEQANKELSDEKKIKIEFVETERVTSATEVRNAIRSNDEEKFRKLVPREIWDQWDLLSSMLKEDEESKNEEIEILEMMLDDDFIEEGEREPTIEILAKKSGLPYSILKKVYTANNDKAVSALKRVTSFVRGGLEKLKFPKYWEVAMRRTRKFGKKKRLNTRRMIKPRTTRRITK